MNTLLSAEATGVNADGYREVLGVATSIAESGAGWNTFFKDLVARGLNGVALLTSHVHAGPVDAIGANVPGQPCFLDRGLPRPSRVRRYTPFG